MIRYLNKAIGREIQIKKKSHLYFGGTSYLSLQTHFRFKRWVLKGVLKYGIHHGASRHSNIRISLFNKTEKLLAKQAQSPAAVLVSSGYLAGQLVAKQFMGLPYGCVYLPHTHSALKVTPYAPETPYEKIAVTLEEIRKEKKQPVLFLDSVDFFGQHYPAFASLKKLDLKDCIVVVDDSHALGITGENGGGSYPVLANLECMELVVTSSLGKGLGVSGGVVLCHETRSKQLKKSPTFGGASPASLAGLYAYNEAPEIYQKQLRLLQKNIHRFTKGVQNLDFFHYHPSHPAFGFQSEPLSKGLETLGFVVTNFPYPTEKDPIMSRIVITAGHKKKDIEKLCKAINTLLENEQV